jgi:hypothetical protein
MKWLAITLLLAGCSACPAGFYCFDISIPIN